VRNVRIFFKNKKLQKICSNSAEAIKLLGAKRGGKLMQRMMELKAAENLGDISRLPPARCHELTGNRSGPTVCRSGIPVSLAFHSR